MKIIPIKLPQQGTFSPSPRKQPRSDQTSVRGEGGVRGEDVGQGEFWTLNRELRLHGRASEGPGH